MESPTGVRECAIHEGENMQYYCTTCSKLICQACVTLGHNGAEHNIEGVKEKSSELRHEMRHTIAEKKIITRRASETSYQNLGVLDIEEEKNAAEEQNNQIDKFVEFHMNVLQQSDQLKKQVAQTLDKSIGKQKTEAVEPVRSVEWSAQVVEQALEDEPDFEYVTQHDSLTNQMSKLNIEQDELHTTLHAAAMFLPNEVHSKVGSVTCKVRKTKLIQTLCGFEEAVNTACSFGSLAVCDHAGKKLLIYHKVQVNYMNGYVLKLCLNLAHLTVNPSDVLIEPNGSFQVASGSILQTYTKDGIFIHQIQTESINISSIKGTSDGRILTGEGRRAVITEYDHKNGRKRDLLTTIMPNCMSLIHDTHIAMCDIFLGKVSVMSIESQQETLSIHIPGVLCVCYDEVTDALLVARSELRWPGYTKPNAGVIEQYNHTTGDFVACIEQGLCCPCGMSITPDGKLIVSDLKTVKIYELL